MCKSRETIPLILTFSSNYMDVMFPYLFVFAIVSLPFREWEPIIIFVKIPAVNVESDPTATIRTVESDPTYLYLTCGIQSCGLIEIAGSDPAVSMAPLNLLAQSHWDYRISYKMFKSDPMVSLQPWEPIRWSHWNRENRSSSLIEAAAAELCNTKLL
jgi:hypothetical protein